MAKRHVLPDGNAVMVPDSMSWAEADAWAQQNFPASFGITPQHGFFAAAKSGANQGIGAGLRGLGRWTGSTRLDAAGKSMLESGQSADAFQNTTDADTDKAFERGLIPGVSSFIDQYITEPIGGMVGRYGIPMAAGAVAAPLAAAAAPELAIAGVGAAALGSGAGFMAADVPMEMGENIQRQEEVTAQRAQQGLAPLQYNDFDTSVSALAQAALLPLLGGASAVVTRPFMKAMGPTLAETAKLVQTGKLTKEQAIAQLNSHGRNYLIKTAEMGAIGVPLMVGTEAIRTAQSGEDVLGEDALGRYGEATHAAIVGAPVFGALGTMGVRRGQVKTIEQADALNQIRQEKERKEAAWQAGTGTQQDLGLEKPQQPKDGFKGNTTPGPVDVITAEFFDQHGVPTKGKGRELRKRYEGIPLDDADGLTALYAELEPLANNKDIADSPAYARAAVTIYKALNEVQQTAPVQRNWIDEQYVENIKAGRARAAKQREIDANTQERIDYGKQKAAEQVNRSQIETAAMNARTQTRQEDMFNHALSRDDMRRPEAEPVTSPEELDARKAEAYAEFEAAYDKYQKTGDSTELDAVVARAKEELGPYDEHLNQQSTRALFDKNGRPTPGARVKDVAPEAEGSDRTGDAVSIPREADAGSSAAGADAGGARPGVSADERPAVGKKRVSRPVKPVPPEVTAAQQALVDLQYAIDAVKGTDTKSQEQKQALLQKRNKLQQAAVVAGVSNPKDVKTKLNQEKAARAAAAKKTTLAEQLTATEAQKEADAEARAAREAEQYLPEATTTGIGSAGKAATVEGFAPAKYRLDSPEHMNNDGTPNHGMQALWWNDLAQMVTDAKFGRVVAKVDYKQLARAAIKEARKNKTITTEQMERAVEEDKKNIELLKKYKRSAVFERMAAVREERRAALSGEKARRKSVRAAQKVIEDFERKEAERKTKEEQADLDAERHMVRRKEKPAELEATDIDEAGVVSQRDLDTPDSDAFMYSRAVGKPKNPHTAESARAEIKKDFASTEAMDDFVRIYETQAEAKAEHPKLTSRLIAGFHTPDGKVGLIAENIEKGSLLGKVLHEVGVHEGMEKILGDRNMKLLQERVAEWAGKNDGSIESKVAKAAVARSLKSTSANKQREAVAYMVEGLVDAGVTPKDATAAGKWLKQFKDSVRKFMSKLGLTKDITPQELVDVAYGAARMALAGKDLDVTAKGKEPKTPRFSDSIPAKLRVTLEKEGANGEVTTHEVRAKEEMRAAERRVKVLEALKRCLG